MSDASKPTTKDPQPGEPRPLASPKITRSQPDPLGSGTVATRICPYCVVPFVARRADQIYCSLRHKRQALRVRQRADRLLDQADGVRKLSAPLLYRRVQREREALALPPAQADPYLLARAKTLEAEHQIERWRKELESRNRHLARLEPPPLRALFAVVLPGERPDIDPQATHLVIVSTDGALAIVGIGYPR